MASTKNTNMMNGDLESGLGFPSTVSQNQPIYDDKMSSSPATKATLQASDDLKKSSCFSRGLIRVVALVISALLVGMLIATVVIFSTGLHLKRPKEISVHDEQFEGGENHHKQHHPETTTDATDVDDTEDTDNIKKNKDAKNWWWWSSSSWSSDFPSSSWSSDYSSSSWSSDYSSSSWTFDFSSSSWSSSSYSSSSYSSGDEDTNPEPPPVDDNPPSNPDEPATSDPPSNPDEPSNPDQPGSGLTWSELQSICGRRAVNSDHRIINGDEVTDEKEWPWAGYLSDSFGFFCGAELISSQWAVTAAHCVEGSESGSTLNITFGQLDRSASDSEYRVEKSISQVISHPSYNSATINNDIALLKLTTPVTFSDTLKPVCINADQDEYNSYKSAESYVVGWGDTTPGGGGGVSDTLQQVEAPLVENAGVCRAAYGDQITDQMICTQTNHKTEPSGSCQGDSGGPMMSLKDQVWYLIGVTSWGYGCAGHPNYPDYPDVLAKVSEFHSWIKSTIENKL